MSELATAAVPPPSPQQQPSPRQQFKARLKLKSSSASTTEESGATATNNLSHSDHRWKRKYDLAVKHPLAKHLSVQGSPRESSTPSNKNNNSHHAITTTPSSETEDDEHQVVATPRSQQTHDFASASSADDSIIRRVEEEIAAARKAASGVVAHHHTTTTKAAVTATTNVVDRRGDAADDAAMELLHNEFTTSRRDGVEQQQQQTPTKVLAVENIFFTDEEWQTTTTTAPTTSPAANKLPSPTSPDAPPQSTSSPRQQQQQDMNMMMEPPTTTERNIVDGKDTYVFRLVRNLRPADGTPAAASKSSPSDEQGGSTDEDNDKVVAAAKEPTKQDSPKAAKDSSSPEETARNNSSISSIDRNNNAVVTMTPTKADSSQHHQRQPSSSGSLADQSLVTTASKKDMDRLRTKELLGSLKEQRNVMSTTNAAASSHSHATPTRRTADRVISESPRSPANHFTFSRANRARERVKTASKGGIGRSSPRSSDRRGSPRAANALTSPRTTPRVHRKKPHFPDHAERLPSKKRGGGKHGADTSSSYDDPKLSRRIRFRNPFPVLKPPVSCRSAERILADNAMGIPETPIRWVKPKRELKQLIVAAMGTSLPRRSNACGALKVLLARQKKNQLALVRTDGFLSALIFAASQSLVEGVDRELALVARTRAVQCLKHVSEPKDNRVLMTHHPGVLECLVKVMKSDGGEGRALASAALAMLAKTATCREGLARVEGLVDAAAKVMNGATSFIAEETEPLNDEHHPEEEEDPTRGFTESESDFTRSDLTGQHTSKSDENDEDATAVSESSMSEEEDEEGETVMEEEEVNDPSLEVTPSWQKSIPMTDSIRYKAEERQQEFTNQGRANACAILLHLSKQCVISPQLCTESEVLRCILSVAREVSNPIHTKCLEIISNMTRFPPNNHILTRFDGMIDTLVAASHSASTENRICALRSLQNMAANPSSKALLATSQVLNLMTACAMRKEVAEKEVAIATIYNITTEPSAVTAITNTKNVVATLVHLAHSPDSSSSIRLLACEALATISLWLQTLAGSGKVPDGISNVPLPSQKTTGWERWD